MSTRVGAYVCPRGVSAIEYRLKRSGVEVLRSFDVPARIESERQAMEQLLRVLADAGIKRAEITLTLRGFGLVHHVLPMPPARDELLAPIVEREIRRLEPGLDAPTVAWLPLPRDPNEATDGPPQRQVLAAGAPRHVVAAMEGAIRAGGHRLVHLTALPAAVQRLHEELVDPGEPSVIVAPLRDGAFLGFFLAGALRIVVEPPLAPDEQHDAGALAEETELGAVFVRQQFRGAQVSRVILAAPPTAFLEAEETFRDRLGTPARRIASYDLASGGLMALGGVLDARSAKPLGLGLAAAPSGSAGRPGGLRSAANASLILAAATAAFVIFETLRARDAATSLHAANQRIEQESFGMTSMRQTADQRKLISDALGALRLAEQDRRDLQDALVGVSNAALPLVRLDSVHLARTDDGWASTVIGSLQSESNARSVERIHEFYRELPKRIAIEKLSLDALTYPDGVDGATPSGVRFQLSFVVPYPKDN